jgi:mRNA-degrading endonuclease toxin of MazEF toxin-antitoxin module
VLAGKEIINVEVISMKKQGYLYWGNVPDIKSIYGKRPFLVLSNDQVNKYLVVVAPLRSVNSSINAHIPIRSEIYPIKDGIIDLNLIFTIKQEYLDEEICPLREEELNKVNEALMTIFSLK